MSVIVALKLKVGYSSRKNPKRWGWGHTVLKITAEFLDLSLYPWKFPRENKASSLENSQNCVTSLGNSNAKNQNPWKFLMILSEAPLEIPHFFINWQLEFPQNLSPIPLEIPASSLESPQNCVTSLGNFNAKNQTSLNSSWFYLEHPWKFLLLF